MKVRVFLAAAIAAALIGGTGALLLPAAASTQASMHTLRFTSVALKQARFSRTTSGAIGKDVNAAGEIIGFDQIHIALHPKTHKISGGVTVDTSGGFIYGTLNLNTKGPVTHGKVTGGTGKFRGATGTITARKLNKAGSRHAVTIIYSR